MMVLAAICLPYLVETKERKSEATLLAYPFIQCPWPFCAKSTIRMQSNQPRHRNLTPGDHRSIRAAIPPSTAIAGTE